MQTATTVTATDALQAFIRHTAGRDLTAREQALYDLLLGDVRAEIAARKN